MVGEPFGGSAAVALSIVAGFPEDYAYLDGLLAVVWILVRGYGLPESNFAATWWRPPVPPSPVSPWPLRSARVRRLPPPRF